MYQSVLKSYDNFEEHAAIELREWAELVNRSFRLVSWLYCKDQPQKYDLFTNLKYTAWKCMTLWSPEFWKISEQCNFPQCKCWTHAGYVWNSRVLLFSSLTPCLLVKIQYSNEMGCDPNGLWADTAAGALGICGLGCGFRWSDCSKQERQVAYGTGSSYCVVAVWLWTFPLINNPVSLGAL